MITLDDTELEHIMTAARPLPPKIRGEFLAALAVELEQQHQRGAGAVYRACRELQRKFFDPPLSTAGKYDCKSVQTAWLAPPPCQGDQGATGCN